ncbi:MAG TPA: hypothetical protein VEA69_18370 [Tepidisphaeraceae bacterium]|nr:hypothetical protein [Tepidisphaeraceae bacterium]
MLTDREILLASALPMLVAAALALLAYWRRRPWPAPLAAAAGFALAYAAQFARPPRQLALPTLPPHDGTDWLFWVAIPLAIVGIAAACARRGWVVIAGLTAGGVAYLLLWPVVKSGAVPHSTALSDASIIAVAGVATVFASRFAAARLGGVWVVAALSIATGGTGVLILASGMKDVGLHGMAAGAAILGAAIAALPRRGLGALPDAAVRSVQAGAERTGFARSAAPDSLPENGSRTPSSPDRAATGVAVVATGIAAALIAAGRGYADPTLPWSAAGVILASPLLLVIGAFIPSRRRWIPGLIALLAVALTVASIAAPAAAKAKRDAEAAKEWGY